jgi:aspartate/methionine/tyrosine aminotransferase
MINFVGGIPVPLSLREDRQFSFDPDEFRSLITPRTKLIILNSPDNPCGGVLTRADLEVVAAKAQKHDCEGSVATLAGTAFGEYGEGFLRFSYATSLETIRHALLRIRETIG